jgi:mono/diheme cytochrome c family protein
MEGILHSRLLRSGIGGLAAVLMAVLLIALSSPPRSEAGWPWNKPRCGHHGCSRNHCVQSDGWAGQWYWMRSPDQEQRVTMAHYNRYCIRCHGVDGRGVWDIPDVPDFTDPRWQNSRPDPQIVNILMEGRGAVMPTFRGTLSLDEAWAMARYLRNFVPGTETARPDVGRAPAPSATIGENTKREKIPAPVPTAGRIAQPAS